MIVKLFGVGDILAAWTLVMLNLGYRGIWVYLAVMSIVYLLVKGVIFFFDFASILDLFSAFMMVLALGSFMTFWMYVFAAWLLQKGIRSFM